VLGNDALFEDERTFHCLRLPQARVATLAIMATPANTTSRDACEKLILTTTNTKGSN
jgi:hypothetical protein